MFSAATTRLAQQLPASFPISAYAPAPHAKSFCIAKNQPECHYSVRLLTGPRADSAGRRTSKARAEGGRAGPGPANLNGNANTNGYGFPGKGTAGTTEPRGWGGGGSGGGGSSALLVSTAMAPLKR